MSVLGEGRALGYATVKRRSGGNEQGAATMDIAFWTKLHDGAQPKVRVVLTDTEISRMLGIPEEAARSLIKAAWPSPLVAKNTEEAAHP
jgi:hypothetical protein